jgi:protein-disulfide isomerase
MKMTMKHMVALGVVSSTLSVLGVASAAETPAPGNVVVQIDGVKLTSADLEQKHSSNLFQARNTYYEAEKKVLDQYVEEYILESAAKKEGLTVEALMKKHVDDTVSVSDITDDALKVYYEGLDTQEGFDTAKDKIREYIRQKRIAKVKTAYMQSLHNAAKVEILLAPPRAQASLNNVEVRGPKNAPVTLIEFADFECPYCQQIEPKLAKLQAEFSGKLAFAYKDLPLPMHSHAQKAAEASHCAMAQGKFWEYHDLLFSNHGLEVPQLKQTARTLGLDGAKFDKCLDSGETAAAVKANLDEAKDLQIPGTPGLFINGRYLEGDVDYNTLRQVVTEELARKAPTQSASR